MKRKSLTTKIRGLIAKNPAINVYHKGAKICLAVDPKIVFIYDSAHYSNNRLNAVARICLKELGRSLTEKIN